MECGFAWGLVTGICRGGKADIVAWWRIEAISLVVRLNIPLSV